MLAAEVVDSGVVVTEAIPTAQDISLAVVDWTYILRVIDMMAMKLVQRFKSLFPIGGALA